MDRYLAFLKVLEQGSFTKAADALGYSQSAVSQMIQSLEAELELTLLHRGHRGVKLSPEGESLLPYIQSSVNHYNAMLEAVRADLEGEFAGKKVIIAAAYSGDPAQGEAWAETVRQAFPELPFMSDPLPLSIGCHVGAGALGAAIFTDDTI